MKATARARLGFTVVNGLATGKGAACAVDLFLSATVALREDRRTIEVRMETEPDEDPTLACETVRRVLDRLGLRDLGADVTTRADAPASCGLKTSSAAANAIAAAANAAAQRYEGEGLPLKDLVGIGIDAALAAKVTVTGAFDDASASARGGICVADNLGRHLIARHEAPDLRAVLHVPGRKVRKTEAGKIDYRPVAPAVALAHELAVQGRWQDAMILNGLAYQGVYGVDFDLHRRAMSAGALAVSVSGTGPAFAAIAHPDRVKAVADSFHGLPGKVLVAPLSNGVLEVAP